ncbi:MAG: hypothetical protein MUF70_11505 [Myxococcota bacterium]|nr:hypothetical protein [Myxococcota bacterium]
MTAAGAPALPRDTVWIVAAGLVVAAAAIARVHNAFAYPPLQDFDAAPHAQYVFALVQGHLPEPRTWAGFHPPLYYALGAALWHLLPGAIPMHTALRLLSAAFGFGAVAVVWRALRHVATPADAAVVAAIVACAPVMAIATSMMGNETACAFFATAALARTLAMPVEPRAALRHGTATVLLATGAALAKSTGLAVVGVIAIVYAWRLHTARETRTRAVLVLVVLPLALVAPHYVRLLAATGNPLSIISSGVPSDLVGSEMAAQPPGERHLAHYASFPIAVFFAPFHAAPGMAASVPGMLHASTWADAHGQFLLAASQPVLVAAGFTALLGLLPTGLALTGFVRILRTPALRACCAAPLLHGALLFAAFLVQTWLVPRYSAVKASYLLSALLLPALGLAVALASQGRLARSLLRVALLAIAAWAAFLTWWGWWL